LHRVVVAMLLTATISCAAGDPPPTPEDCAALETQQRWRNRARVEDWLIVVDGGPLAPEARAELDEGTHVAIEGWLSGSLTGSADPPHSVHLALISSDVGCAVDEAGDDGEMWAGDGTAACGGDGPYLALGPDAPASDVNRVGEAFACRLASLPRDGCEGRSLEATLSALDRAPPDFRREEARLLVMIVTHEQARDVDPDVIAARLDMHVDDLVVVAGLPSARLSSAAATDTLADARFDTEPICDTGTLQPMLPRSLLAVTDRLTDTGVVGISLCDADWPARARQPWSLPSVGGAHCLPRTLPRDADGLVQCELTERLGLALFGERCADLPGREPVPVEVVDGREVCRVLQLSNTEGAGSSRPGFYVHDESSRCGDLEQQLAYSESYAPTPGAVLELRCLPPHELRRCP
jgi:hypothetical protein